MAARELPSAAGSRDDIGMIRVADDFPVYMNAQVYDEEYRQELCLANKMSATVIAINISAPIIDLWGRPFSLRDGLLMTCLDEMIAHLIQHYITH